MTSSLPKPSMRLDLVDTPAALAAQSTSRLFKYSCACVPHAPLPAECNLQDF